MDPTAGDVLFLDTNLLLTATDASRQNHEKAKHIFRAITKLITENAEDFTIFSEIQAVDLTSV